VNARQSSLTVQQIVARQEAHFGAIKNSQGIAVHSESKLNAQGQPTQTDTQYIYFAFAGDKSVTLAMPEAAAKVYGMSQGQVPWPQITAATLIDGDTVYSIHKPAASGNTRATTGPTVIAVPYNPAVHENNPLVAFHPRQVGDEQLPLRELARAIPEMTQRPVVTDVAVNGRPLLQIDFANPGTPGEQLYYLIDPNRGYLPVKISRMSNGRPISVSDILLAPTPEGYWMPARRERVTYDAAGKPATRQSWHYEFVAVNKGLAPMALTLMYFNLPMTTQVKVVEPLKTGNPQGGNPAPRRQTPARVQPGSAQPGAPRGTPRPSPTPPPTPIRVKL
jgi:hypothetical protein